MQITVGAALNELGGTKTVADALGVSLPTVSTWRARGFIPAHRWPDIVRLAASKGRAHITFEALADMRPAPSEACA